jgi:hypothetical protein
MYLYTRKGRLRIRLALTKNCPRKATYIFQIILCYTSNIIFHLQLVYLEDTVFVR